MQPKKQLSHKAIYKDVTFNKNIIPNYTKNSNKNFKNLKQRGFISEKQTQVLPICF